MTGRSELERICREHGVRAVYLFGSRAADGLRLLDGQKASEGPSDLDVGLVVEPGSSGAGVLAALQVAFEDLFAPLAVDLLPIDRVDPIFQFRVISGERIYARSSRAADLFELEVMRSASDLLPVQRRIERDRFGTSTT
jgi:predicted nucleotidyltransferase